MFFILLSQIDETLVKEKQIEKFIMTRFQPRQNDRAVFNELLSVIEHSNDAYTDYIRDWLHEVSQEKTIQKGFYSIIKSAVGVIKYVTPAGLMTKSTEEQDCRNGPNPSTKFIEI